MQFLKKQTQFIKNNNGNHYQSNYYTNLKSHNLYQSTINTIDTQEINPNTTIHQTGKLNINVLTNKLNPNYEIHSCSNNGDNELFDEDNIKEVQFHQPQPNKDFIDDNKEIEYQQSQSDKYPINDNEEIKPETPTIETKSTLPIQAISFTTVNIYQPLLVNQYNNDKKILKINTYDKLYFDSNFTNIYTNFYINTTDKHVPSQFLLIYANPLYYLTSFLNIHLITIDSSYTNPLVNLITPNLTLTLFCIISYTSTKNSKILQFLSHIISQTEYHDNLYNNLFDNYVSQQANESLQLLYDDQIKFRTTKSNVDHQIDLIKGIIPAKNLYNRRLDQKLYQQLQANNSIWNEFEDDEDNQEFDSNVYSDTSF